jgi:hypothetical protein
VGGDPVNLSDPTGLAASSEQCRRLLERIRNIQRKIDERTGELEENPRGLPETAPGDLCRPSLSRAGHRRLINMDKAQLASLKALYLAICSCDPPGGTPAVAGDPSFLDRKYWEKVTGLTGGALLAYLLISESTRLFPPRNLVPIP